MWCSECALPLMHIPLHGTLHEYILARDSCCLLDVSARVFVVPSLSAMVCGPVCVIHGLNTRCTTAVRGHDLWYTYHGFCMAFQLAQRHACIGGRFTGYCCLACRCTELQQALHSLQDVTGVLVDAGRGIVASAGGRQIKRVMRNFAEAHQGSS